MEFELKLRSTMGLLSVGTPFSWEETKKRADYVKIEYTLIHLDHENKSSRLLLKCSELLPSLQEDECNNPGTNTTAWRMEYADYMIEGTPGQPFGGCLTQFNRVEHSMKIRREELMKLLNQENEAVICFAAFPRSSSGIQPPLQTSSMKTPCKMIKHDFEMRIGCQGFTEPIHESSPLLNPVSKSLYYPDRAIYPKHPRFVTLTRNIRSRKGRRQEINLPVFRDKSTPNPFLPDIPNDDGEAKLAIKPDHVYMDCMGFGMGCSCLQVTFQACNIDEARMLYDQLAVLAPIMMALSAASPAFQGTLTDVDCRWDVISGSVDDRTDEERGLKPLTNDKFRIAKSRYDCVDMYISPCSKDYNDLPVKFEPHHKQMLLDAGVDDILAEHIAHLFIRDPLSLFSEKLEISDDVETDHFENIQSTNWQSIRFKPPPPGSSIGWRVEFRTMEVQLTDFENAAYVVFIVLLTRVILSYKLNLLMPISKVERNMRTAVKRDAVLQQQFYFRKALTCSHDNEDHFELMTIDTIINGKENGFPGLITMMKSYLDSIDVDVDTACTIGQYLSLISKRASGKCLTTASWIREYIRSHPHYKFDSNVSERITYDLSVECDLITRGEKPCPTLFGNPKTKSVNVTLPKCEEVKREVEQLTEKILQLENDEKTRNSAINDSDFGNQFVKSLGVSVANRPDHVQM